MWLGVEGGGGGEGWPGGEGVQTRMHCILIGNGHPLNKPIVHTKSKENCVKTLLIKLITSSISNYRKNLTLSLWLGVEGGGGEGWPGGEGVHHNQGE